MAKSSWSHALAWASLAGALAGCSTVPDSHAPTSPQSDDPLAIDGGNGELVPKIEPPSRSGNPDTYRVFGRRYRVKETSEGYREQGIASWYGWDFHGRKTSSGPPYNMFDLTAAHKSLPIPTYVRVTNLENGRNVVVKVNDRGPFVGRRIIDLSYAAADRLDMLGQGTAQVEVAALEPYQSLPELAARRAEARERLASRQNRPEPKFEPAAIPFAREEPIRLAALDQSPSRAPQPQPESAIARVETPEPSTSHQNPPESKPESATVQIAREEPMRPVAPEPPRPESAAARAEMPERPAGRPIQSEQKSEPAAIPFAREESVQPTALVVDTPSVRLVTSTTTLRTASRARSPARSTTTAARTAPNSVPPRPVLVESPIKTRERDRTGAPIRLASAAPVFKGKGMVEDRQISAGTGNKNGRLNSAEAAAERRDGRSSSNRPINSARRDSRMENSRIESGTGNRQGARTLARDPSAAKPATMRLASLKVNRPRVATD